jgi:hypothetical protein
MTRSLCGFVLLAVASVSAVPTVEARSLFEGTFTIDGVTAQAGTNRAESFADLFTNAGLRSIVGTYTDVSAADAVVSLRGVPARLTYLAGSPVLRLRLPTIGVDVSFNGATRDESQDLAIRWFRGEGAEVLTSFLQEAVRTTAVDPVAGNPSSLMSMMGASDFSAGLGGNAGLGGQTGARIGLGARFGRYSAGDFDTNVYTLPLSTNFNLGRGLGLIVDGPITVTETQGAQSYSGSVGLGLRVPVPLPLPEYVTWSVTPMARTGAVGSIEIGAAAALWSLSATSQLDLRLGDQGTLSIGNMIGQVETFPIKIGRYELDYALSNNIFRNGVIYTRGVGQISQLPASVSLFAIDTRFTGSALFVSSYQEFGAFITMGDPLRFGPFQLPLRAGFTYLNGENGYRGFSLSLGASF